MKSLPSRHIESILVKRKAYECQIWCKDSICFLVIVLSLKSAATNFLFHIKHVVMTDEQASQDF